MFKMTAESKYLITGAADNQMRLWEVATGKCLYIWEFPTAVKRVAFSSDDTKILCITEERMGYRAFVRVFELDRSEPTKQSKEPISEFSPPGSKPTVCLFTYDANSIITGHEDGKIALWDAATGEELESVAKAHTDNISDLQLSPDKSYFVTSSKDKTAKVRDTMRSIRHSILIYLSESSVARRQHAQNYQDLHYRNSPQQCCDSTWKTLCVPYLTLMSNSRLIMLPSQGSRWRWPGCHVRDNYFATAG